MKVYIRVIDTDFDRAAWYNDTTFQEDYETGRVTLNKGNTEKYLMDGWGIYGTDHEYRRGTPFTSITYLKKAIKDAKAIASWDGWDVKVELWKETAKGFVPVKLNRITGKLDVLNPAKFVDPLDNSRD